MRFLHCSDVHITHDYFHSPVWPLGWRRWIALLELKFGGRSQDYAQARSTLSKIAEDARRHKVDHLIVSGDLTAYAMESEFEGAKAALSGWVENPSLCSVIPGNHDTYTREVVRERRFQRYFGHLLRSDMPEYCREEEFPFVRLLGNDVAVVGLCSARLNAAPGLSYGAIGKAQLAGLKAIVEDVRMQHRAVLVAVHHAPLRADGRPDKPSHGLKDARALFDVLRGPRFAVLHGHIHHRYHHEANAERPHILGAGSSTQKGREGYWLIDVQDGKFTGFLKTEVGASEPQASSVS
jgi:3',5'-cyclic AMP phosphodiesterase CpdA